MNDSMESFSCCGFHKECIKQGKCVRTRYWLNYEKICTLYRRVISKMKKGPSNETEELYIKQAQTMLFQENE